LKENISTEVSGGSKGITLLEMIVALVIFTAVMLSATMIFKNSLYRFGRQASGKKIYSEAARVMAYMERYLPSAMCNDMEGRMRIDFAGAKDSLRFVSAFSEGPESDLAKFGIYFDGDESAVKAAVLRVDGRKPDFVFPAGFAGAQVLGECIDSFRLSYFNGSDWQDEWDTGRMAEPCLPRMIRVELKVFSRQKTEGERSEKTFTRIIGIIE